MRSFDVAVKEVGSVQTTVSRFVVGNTPASMS